MSKRFRARDRETLALTDVDLGIRKREFVTLLGQSGCGKTTMLRILAGLTQPSTGEVTIGGRALWRGDHRDDEGPTQARPRLPGRQPVPLVQEQQFRESQPDSMFLNTADYVTDGLNYISSQKGIQTSGDQIKAYMRGLRGAMEQILEDKKNGYPDTLKKLRAKYDFDELKKDSVAKAYLDFNVGSWVIDGEDKLLKTDPAKWKATYDAAVKVKAAKSGVDVHQERVERHGLIHPYG